MLDTIQGFRLEAVGLLLGGFGLLAKSQLSPLMQLLSPQASVGVAGTQAGGGGTESDQRRAPHRNMSVPLVVVPTELPATCGPSHFLFCGTDLILLCCFLTDQKQGC